MNHPSPAVHVCLVSAQATPNLTPALDPETRPRRAMLASYQPLEPHVLRRARDYGILTCAGPELRDLKAILHRWLVQRRHP
ncbi:hypothetical protein [Methylomagnum sp.]